MTLTTMTPDRPTLTDATARADVGGPFPPPRPVRGKRRSRASRQVFDRFFVWFCILAAAVSVVTLVTLLTSIVLSGTTYLTWSFFRGVPSRTVSDAGMWPAIIGTVMTTIVCIVAALPIGIATAVLLEEFSPKQGWKRRAHGFVQLNITNLAGVPSIVYGILGLTVFVQAFNLMGTQIEPGVEVGVRWFDRYLTEGRETLLVPVEGRHADLTAVATAESRGFVDAEGRPVTGVRLVDVEDHRSEADAQRDALSTFEQGLRTRLDEIDAGQDPPAVEGAARAAWAEAGLRANFGDVKARLVPALVRAEQLSGRDARRAVRQSVTVVEEAEANARFSGVLLSDAQASRVSQNRPWYLRLPFGRSVLAGGLTLMLVILPIIIIASQESLRGVPRSLRFASLAMGATPWQTVWRTTLPSALPGIMTGTILAVSRAVGEAAPILIIAGIVYITFTPEHLMDDFTTMPLQIFDWASRPQEEFHKLAASGIIVLLSILLTFNAVAVYIRHRTESKA